MRLEGDASHRFSSSHRSPCRLILASWSTTAAAAVTWALSTRTVLKHAFPIRDGLHAVCHQPTQPLADDRKWKVELAWTSDGRTVVCYRPSVDIPYEHTKPIPRPDPIHNSEETHDHALKTRFEVKGQPLEQGPRIEQLSKRFFTTKHRWYPRGPYHRRRKKRNPPRQMISRCSLRIRNVNFCLICHLRKI
ncbi:39S ribosomal protein L42, mitochondrial-like [Echinops telfairi]|uniref:39S ribosomal protein L42, mitochondrial-like n=1 Tax=Echinops telfairi TaxID=9371 RepID=A0AC55D7W0_ECHTE|nr:39S ribosomal protein L42, mitochondrial-like [Echinops telfairi]